MGSYTSLAVDGYEIHTTKSFVDALIMTVFSESDRYFRRRNSDGEWSTVEESEPARTVDLDSEEVQCGYRATGRIVRDRLDAMGFTLDVSRRVFEAGVQKNLEEIRELSAQDPESDHLWADTIVVLENLSFDGWIREFSELKRRGIYSWHLSSWSENPVPTQVSDLARYMLADDSDHWLGYPISDIRHFLRAVIDACGDAAILEQDVTEVTYAGWYELGQAIVEDSRVGLLAGFPSYAKIIILTEGRSDRRVLEGALKLIYPHLVDLYSFMDFDTLGVPGGAGHLVNTVKAFAGAGIANRVVALFDNDTGARSALRSFAANALPRSIRILRYPSIDLAKNYPTIGPNGLVQMDVNGLACSLELYFGEDVLRQSDGALTPVQWRGYDQALRQYQGELLDKERLQGAFFKKLQAAISDSSVREKQDWSGITMILDAIRSVFSPVP